jgi:hypothetical protein
MREIDGALMRCVVLVLVMTMVGRRALRMGRIMMMRMVRGRMGGGCRNRGHAAIEQMARLQYQFHPAFPVIFGNEI